MAEFHVRQPWFTCSACGTFTENKSKMQKFQGTGESRYICRNEQDKACFQRNIAFGDFKNLPRRTASNKIFTIASNPQSDACWCALAPMV